MEAKIVDVERGWGWIADGWSLFMKNPGVWILMILIYALIMILLLFAPILGILASGLLGTMLAGGAIYGASRLDSGGTLEIWQLFQAFRDSARTVPMFILGLISLVSSLLMAVMSEGLIAGSYAGAEIMSGGQAMQLGVAAIIGMLLVLLVAMVMGVLLFYAIPLVMLQGIEPVEAIKFSILGCLKNWLPLLVFGLIYMVLTILALIPLGLGLLILGPVTIGSWYQSYKELYVD